MKYFFSIITLFFSTTNQLHSASMEAKELSFEEVRLADMTRRANEAEKKRDQRRHLGRTKHDKIGYRGRNKRNERERMR